MKERVENILIEVVAWIGALLLYGGVALLLFGCKSTVSSEQIIDYRHMARISEKMDSLIHTTATWQQSIYEKQTALVDFFRQSEVRDTSHTIFLGEKGDTTKEVITIYKERTIEHTTQESSQEWREKFLKQTDSLFAVNKNLEEKVDSVLHNHEKTAVVEKEPTFGDKLKWFAGGIVITIIGCIACCTAYMKKSRSYM